MSRFCAIVLSGGTGKRMQSSIPKQYLMLGDKPVLAHSLLAFEKSEVNGIVIVCASGDEDYIRKEFVEKYCLKKVAAIVPGGAERYHSVFNGLKACDGADYVLIHDGARPYVSQDVIKRNMEDVVKYNAVVTAVKATDTVKIVDKDGYIEFTPDRNRVYSMQTPQTFEYGTAFNAYSEYIGSLESDQSIHATDDAQVVEMFSDVKVRITEGDYSNIKITVPRDLKVNEIN